MSHFVLIAALPAGTRDIQEELADRLAPYDENNEVEPYRDYEQGEAADHWWYRALKDDHEAALANDHSKIKPYEPDQLGLSSASSRETPEEQWAGVLRDAEVFRSLPDPVTWEALTAAYNRYYCEGFPYSDSEPHLYDAGQERMYTLSTYNPESKWDWYQIGGRWSDYFPVNEEEVETAIRLRGLFPVQLNALISGERSWTLDNVAVKHDHVDGGEKRFLDLERLRSDKEKEAAEEYDKYQAFAANYPKATGWSEFLKEFIDLPGGDSKWAVRDRVREVYRAQPLIRALDETPEFRFAFECLVDKYSVSREDFLHAARRDAVPGFATLTLDKEWVAPGEMGMFGMSTDDPEGRAQFKDWTNEYIDNLPEDTILVAVDLHI
jgi:hypothetical protein